MLWGFKNSNQNNIIYILIKIVNILKTYKLSWNGWHLLDGRLMQSTCSFYVCFILQMYVHRGFIHTDVCSTKFHTLWCMFWVYRNPLLNFFQIFSNFQQIFNIFQLILSWKEWNIYLLFRWDSWASTRLEGLQGVSDGTSEVFQRSHFSDYGWTRKVKLDNTRVRVWTWLS